MKQNVWLCHNQVKLALWREGLCGSCRCRGPDSRRDKCALDGRCYPSNMPHSCCKGHSHMKWELRLAKVGLLKTLHFRCAEMYLEERLL